MVIQNDTGAMRADACHSVSTYGAPDCAGEELCFDAETSLPDMQAAYLLHQSP